MHTLQSEPPRFEHLSGTQVEAISRFIRVKQSFEWRSVRAMALMWVVWLVVWLGQSMETMFHDSLTGQLLPSLMAWFVTFALLRTKYHLLNTERALRTCDLTPSMVSLLHSLPLSNYDPWIRQRREGTYTLTLRVRPSRGSF